MKIISALLLFSLNVAMALTLPQEYLVIKILGHKDIKKNHIILKDYPTALIVDNKNKSLIKCLSESLHKNKKVKIEIGKNANIKTCTLVDKSK